jgi:Domain of unknown function (DUF1992)
MTDRKPAGMTFTSWIDKQIAEATERGAFDNLPGAGKPIPRHEDEDAGQAWLREYLRKEGVSAEALLPPPLRLRKAIDRLAAAVPALATERDVRDAVAELNQEIREWRRIPLGPPVFVPLVDDEAMVSRWRAAQPGTASLPAAQPDLPSGPVTHPSGRAARWWRRSARGQGRRARS